MSKAEGSAVSADAQEVGTRIGFVVGFVNHLKQRVAKTVPLAKDYRLD